jgi:pyruvate ferredoxin oxidoreductase delta subunit
VAKPMEEHTWRDIEVGSVVLEPGNAAEYKTGDWRTAHPVVDKAHCIKCAVCWMFCPDGAVEKTDDGYYEANLEYCKGCGICVNECTTQCITLVEEAE